LELRDERLKLRPWQDRDASELHHAVQESVDSVGKWLPWCREHYSRADATSWTRLSQATWRMGEQFAFAICDAPTGHLLGGAGLNRRDPQHRSANLGYWIRQSRQGFGFAAAAGALVAQFAFERLGLIRVELIIQPENRASRRTAEKMGARFEGIARQRLWIGSRATDAAVYAVIPQDPR
jgi:RimJ/RimL family protein N-acetyltransferase